MENGQQQSNAEMQQLILEERKVILGVKNDMIKAFDQAVLALSAAGLTVSVGLLQARYLSLSPWLEHFWWCLIGAAACTTGSMLLSHEALEGEIIYLHGLLLGQKPDRKRIDRLHRVTKGANWVAGSLLIVAMFVLSRLTVSTPPIK